MSKSRVVEEWGASDTDHRNGREIIRPGVDNLRRPVVIRAYRLAGTSYREGLG